MNFFILLSWHGVFQKPQADPSWCSSAVPACYQSSSPRGLAAAWSSCASRWGWWWTWAEPVRWRTKRGGAWPRRCKALPSGSGLPTTCSKWVPCDSGTCGSSPTGWLSRTACVPSRPVKKQRRKRRKSRSLCDTNITFLKLVHICV